MNTVQKLGYSTLTLALTAEHTFAAIKQQQAVDGNVRGDDATAEAVVQKWIGNALVFLAILAVIYGLYGGFLILTAGGDDEKVKTGKKIIMQVAIGILVIFLAYSIVNFVISLIVGGTMGS